MKRDRREDYRRRRAIVKESALMRRAAGAHITAGRAAEGDIASRRVEMHAVINKCDTTSILMGDPPRHDPRRTWAPHLAGDA